ncbi:Uncharacterised protein [Halioglobus japonicus]|nr:Uncharacterised protein [Halioglobus japonicus]
MPKWIFTLALFVLITSQGLTAVAAPILSADGSTLSNLDVNGTLYDVSFGDGVISDLFPASEVSSPGWYSLAGDVTAAIYEALFNITPLIDHTALLGCEDGPGIPGYVGPEVCIVLTPDKLVHWGQWGADNLAVVNQLGVFIGPPPAGITSLSGDADTGALHFLTLATFTQAQASVPSPGSTVLVLIGLLLVLGNSSRGNTVGRL